MYDNRKKTQMEEINILCTTHILTFTPIISSLVQGCWSCLKFGNCSYESLDIFKNSFVVIFVLRFNPFNPDASPEENI